MGEDATSPRPLQSERTNDPQGLALLAGLVGEAHAVPVEGWRAVADENALAAPIVQQRTGHLVAIPRRIVPRQLQSHRVVRTASFEGGLVLGRDDVVGR